ncbi:type II toxin-antitoxin system CcdA family antitoxin [Patescibacteria group bacterium]|nr:type II toxin-antitoxin system CcdA family antitoxin [Patescibacteria group bacterium]
MAIVFDESAPKKAANLSVNSDLLKKAKELKINLSATFENALTDLIREKQSENWKKSNKQAIKAYNTHVEKHGVFSKGMRSF